MQTASACGVPERNRDRALSDLQYNYGALQQSAACFPKTGKPGNREVEILHEAILCFCSFPVAEARVVMPERKWLKIPDDAVQKIEKSVSSEINHVTEFIPGGGVQVEIQRTKPDGR